MRLEMSNKARKELLDALSPSYAAANTHSKTKILENFIAATGYSRKHAITLFNHGRPNASKTRSRRRSLGVEAISALVLIWEVSNRICSKRLVPFLPEAIANLEKNGHLSLSGQAKCELYGVSAATVDRLLKQERDKAQRSLSLTRRASLVKSKVPVRTFGDWNDVTPGFLEIDTVGHSSSDASGPFLSTLNMTDIATCWTVPIALMRKGSVEVVAAIGKAARLLPFPLLGLDFDNGSEFLNELLIEWCEKHEVTYTRSREYKKNDQAWIEEKNRSVVRRNIGRVRYEGRKSWTKLQELYDVLNLYFNFFQPCQKLLSKSRKGAKTYKKHDEAKTPYQRVLESPHVSGLDKQALRERRQGLDMFTLFGELTRLQTELKDLAVDVPSPVLAAALAQRNATHKFITRDQVESHARTRNNTGLKKKMKELIAELKPGTVISAKDLHEMGTRSALDSYLHYFEQEGTITKLGWGIYQIPQSNDKESYPKNEIAGTNLNESTV